MSFKQGTPGTFSTINGVNVATAQWSSVTDFELQPTAALRCSMTARTTGWKNNYPTNTFKNQGACIAATVAHN